MSSQKGSGAMGNEGSRVHPLLHLLPLPEAPLIPPGTLKQSIPLLLHPSPLCSSSCPSVSRERKNSYKINTFSFSKLLAPSFCPLWPQGDCSSPDCHHPFNSWHPVPCSHLKVCSFKGEFAVIRRECKKPGANELDWCQSLIGCEQRCKCCFLLLTSAGRQLGFAGERFWR